MMRIVIDMQAAQAANKNRGIGRYTMSWVRALIRNRGNHEIFLVLNGNLSDTILSIREAFFDLLPPEQIHIWHADGPLSAIDPSNSWRRKVAAITREAAIASLRPSIIVVTSLFEGLGDDAVVSIGALEKIAPCAVILYDLIPAVHKEAYLSDTRVASWYEAQFAQLKQADFLLAISESSRTEAIELLNVPPGRVINISADADPHFGVKELSPSERRRLLAKYDLVRPFVMYTGGIDPRKNVEGLIRAWSKLPPTLRIAHSLAIVCAVTDSKRNELLQLARSCGISGEELVFTGYVPEQDLVDLYNSCHLFIFPSYHEGFGLPALEAMRCGAAVIASNTSSLPEVLANTEALFNPYDETSMADALTRALEDADFRNTLKLSGREQASAFSWDATGKRTIVALETLHAADTEAKASGRMFDTPQMRIACISPVPPAKSGIADYVVELLTELIHFYAVELVVEQAQVELPENLQHLPIRSTSWFVENASEFDRILYHFGNSDFHCHMFELLTRHPGVVVLHDFYLSGVAAHMEIHKQNHNFWIRSLYNSHGYHAVHHRIHKEESAEVIAEYPCNYDVLSSSLGIIVHSAHSKKLAAHWYGINNYSNWSVIPLLRSPIDANSVSRTASRRNLNIRDDQFIVCSFGMLGRTKLNHRLIHAWLSSPLAKDVNCMLVFVGENDETEYGINIEKLIKRSGCGDRIKITGWTNPSTFKHYLMAADIGVQLRSQSRGETSAAVLDCLNAGIPTIINANGSLSELDDEAVWKLPDSFTDKELEDALTSLYRAPELRATLSLRASEIIKKHHNPKQAALAYSHAIESFYFPVRAGLQATVNAITSLSGAPVSNDAYRNLARNLDRSVIPHNTRRQLFVDVSELVQRDARSGIQRVVRSILSQWLFEPPSSVRIEPVYATADSSGYRYARAFTLDLLDCPSHALTDDPISYRAGDLFLALDLQPAVTAAQSHFFEEMRQAGVDVRVVVYDLLPVTLENCFVHGAKAGHEQWLNTVMQQDGAICISQAVANELDLWVRKSNSGPPSRFSIDWFHLGADLSCAMPSRRLPRDVKRLLTRVRSKCSFLMVGTLEPRKGHADVLTSFEQLWLKGSDITLLIVGKVGWLVDELVDRIRSHPEFGDRLIWIDDSDDELLEQLYAASSCLIAASYGEGFGLPLIEAAQHKLPIIARDIPVFREVAGEHAFYFGEPGELQLAEAIEAWLNLFDTASHPRSDNMPWLTWKESAAQLLSIVLNDKHEAASVTTNS